MADEKKMDDFVESINKAYKSTVITKGSSGFPALKLARFSSGIFPLDMALGGGWPFSRIAIVAGEYSTGKSIVAIKAASEIEKYDHTTKIHKGLLKEGTKFTPGKVLYVDVEGTLDLDWCIANGFNVDNHVVARPEYSEQVVDIVTAAIRENLFDLIIVDSIAAMTPATEIEESTESQQMGLAARINNKAMRRWNASLVKMSQEGAGGPLLLCINQFRLKIGMFFGDPRTLPGGKGQEFCSSIILYTKSQDYKDKAATEATPAKELSGVALSGVVHKNKTYIPRQHYKFILSLKEVGSISKGVIDNTKDLVDAGKRLGLIKKVGKEVKFGKYTYSSYGDMQAKVAVSPVVTQVLWRSCIKAECGVTV